MEYLQFADNGQGVPESQLSHIFERFWRGDEARSTKNNDGSGLGLFIVKYIIEAHGGFVTAKNDNGLVIEMRLPCEKEETNE
jgi:signal transduction histidine kinase